MMKKQIHFIIVGAALLFSCFSCIDLEDMNIDPNNATQTDPALLLTNVAFDAFSEAGSNPAHAVKMMILTSGESPYQVYKWTRGDFDYYNNLRDVVKMQEEAVKKDEPAYEALALFFRAHYFYTLTMQFGDIPCSDALKAESEKVYQPAYDSQETVFETVLNELEQANNLLKENPAAFTGDIIYNGNTTKWRRLINAYRLRVLMTLSHKSAVKGVAVQAAFAEIVNNEELMAGLEDNGQVVFLDQQDNRYPFFNDSDFGSGRFMDSTYVAMLKLREDPRLFAIATQTPAAEKQGLPVDDFAAYDGGDPAIAYSLVNDKATAGGCSKPAARYYRNPTNEPVVLLGYPEQQLLLAEAALRGWIRKDDKALYDSAVKASFLFYETYAKEYASYITQEAARSYLQGNRVAYTQDLTFAQKLERIIIQKYIPSFLQGNMWLPYYEQLRTGYPEFRRAAGVQLPYRWMYPQSEYNNNAAHVEAALASQFGGTDRTTDKPWWLR